MRNMKISEEASRYIRPRWRRWLKGAIDELELTPASLARLLSGSPEDPDLHPRAMVNSWLDESRTVSPDAAFQVGQLLCKMKLERSSVNEVCGPVALWAAGHYSALIRLLRDLAARRWDVPRRIGAPKLHAVTLYGTLWSGDPELISYPRPRTKTMPMIWLELMYAVPKARENLRSEIESPVVRDLYSRSWNNPIHGNQTEPPFGLATAAMRIARMDPPAVMMASAWAVLQRWAQQVDKDTYDQIREPLEVFLSFATARTLNPGG